MYTLRMYVCRSRIGLYRMYQTLQTLLEQCISLDTPRYCALSLQENPPTPGPECRVQRRSVHVVVFILQTRRGDHLLYLFLPPFAAGHAFCSSMLDTLLYQVSLHVCACACRCACSCMHEAFHLGMLDLWGRDLHIRE